MYTYNYSIKIVLIEVCSGILINYYIEYLVTLRCGGSIKSLWRESLSLYLDNRSMTVDKQ